MTLFSLPPFLWSKVISHLSQEDISSLLLTSTAVNNIVHKHVQHELLLSEWASSGQQMINAITSGDFSRRTLARIEVLRLKFTTKAEIEPVIKLLPELANKLCNVKTVVIVGYATEDALAVAKLVLTPFARCEIEVQARHAPLYPTRFGPVLSKLSSLKVPALAASDFQYLHGIYELDVQQIVDDLDAYDSPPNDAVKTASTAPTPIAPSGMNLDFQFNNNTPAPDATPIITPTTSHASSATSINQLNDSDSSSGIQYSYRGSTPAESVKSGNANASSNNNGIYESYHIQNGNSIKSSNGTPWQRLQKLSVTYKDYVLLNRPACFELHLRLSLDDNDVTISDAGLRILKLIGGQEPLDFVPHVYVPNLNALIFDTAMTKATLDLLEVRMFKSIEFLSISPVTLPLLRRLRRAERFPNLKQILLFVTEFSLAAGRPYERYLEKKKLVAYIQTIAMMYPLDVRSVSMVFKPSMFCSEGLWRLTSQSSFSRYLPLVLTPPIS